MNRNQYVEQMTTTNYDRQLQREINDIFVKMKSSRRIKATVILMTHNRFFSSRMLKKSLPQLNPRAVKFLLLGNEVDVDRVSKSTGNFDSTIKRNLNPNDCMKALHATPYHCQRCPRKRPLYKSNERTSRLLLMGSTLS